MAVFRISKKETPSVMVSKSVVDDTSLSAKAKGILLYILSKPNYWQMYESEITSNFKDGRDSIRSGIKELIDAGYIERDKKRESGRFDGYDYTVHESK